MDFLGGLTANLMKRQMMRQITTGIVDYIETIPVDVLEAMAGLGRNLTGIEESLIRQFGVDKLQGYARQAVPILQQIDETDIDMAYEEITRRVSSTRRRVLAQYPAWAKEQLRMAHKRIIALGKNER